MLLAVSFAAVACADEPAGEVSRRGRLGSFRDLVLVERPTLGAAGGLFVDRFEVTRSDWSEFAASEPGRAIGARDVAADGKPTLPIGIIDLAQARSFAHWRLLRLPRLDEWRFASVGSGSSLFPWGDRVDLARANTGELGLGEATPVGTFESGRRASGDQPYDLVGNVSEWTETVAPDWWRDRADATMPSIGAAVARDEVRRRPGLMVWQGVGGLVPPVWIAMAGGASVPRYVVGSDFQSEMKVDVEEVPAGDRRLRTGFRLYSTPVEVVQALCADTGPIDPADEEQMRRFLRRGRHREALVGAWSRLVANGVVLSVEHPLGRLLQQELFSGSAPTGR